ncbi:SCY1-like protein 2-like [Homarus americanus]|uniref:SCY1-like protein 2-like n=1 Tax=Homarus americanus TaxID=6706 RepID=A0A8J5K5P2_HOMAM|nr:SCY1-like protein 2-like [Homarus americanus]
MELMLSKLRSSVSSAATSAVSNAVQIASQVSNYLPGNPVTREFEATAHIASAGPGLLWKVYKGYKKSTKQDAAIFVFEKRLIEKWDKQEREIMLDKLRKGVSQLTRLRHPQVLTVQHPLEESRETIAFATEPVFASLANVLGHTENMPVPSPPTLKDYKLYDVEIKYGLLQVNEGLAFLHNSVKIVHCNICPENIVLNHQGAWKLFGFDFCVANQTPADQPPFWPFEEYDPKRHPNCQPHLDYLAPEYALTHTLDTAADLFPLGVIIHAIFNEGRPLFHNNKDFGTFKRNCCELKNTNTLNLLSIPDGLRDQVRLLLHATPQLRPDALQFSKIMLQLMQKMELLLGKTPAEDVRSDVLPLLYRALECDTQQIQELCLSVIPSCAQLVENHAMKNALLPKIKKLCLGTGYLSVRVNCLVCVGKILEHLDRWLVMDDVFPFLEQIPSRESPVVMAIVGVFKVALNHKKLGITKEILATRVLPFLFPLSIENSLTPTQHLAIMTLIKDMAEKVETEHRTKLEQLNSIKDEQKMVKQQGLQDAVQKPPPLLPSPPAPSSSIKKPLENQVPRSHISALSPTSQASPNLAPSLINSNLNTMNSQTTQTLMTSRNSQQGVSSAVGNSSSGLGIMNDINKSSMNYIGRPSNVSMLPTSGGVSQSVSGMMSWPSQAPAQNARMQTPNYSAFNNLLPTQSKPLSLSQMTYNTTMNTTVNSSIVPNSTNSFGSMMSPMQPLTNTLFSAATNTGVKPLSTSDINDLLS